MVSDDLKVQGIDGVWRAYDEHYDCMSDVKDDPHGAWEAIQKQHACIEILAAERDALQAGLADGSFYQEKDIDAMIDRAERAEARLSRIAAMAEETGQLCDEGHPISARNVCLDVLRLIDTPTPERDALQDQLAKAREDALREAAEAANEADSLELALHGPAKIVERILALLDTHTPTPAPSPDDLVRAAEMMVKAYREESDKVITAFYALEDALAAMKGGEGWNGNR